MLPNMKKWLLIFTVAVLAAGSYFIFSAPSSVQKVIAIQAKVTAANRCFMDTSAWRRWWPAGSGYRIDSLFYNEVRFRLNTDMDKPVSLRIAQLNTDSVLLGWEGNLSRRGQVEMDSVLEAFRSFVGVAKNIYGVNFQRTMSNDSTLITIIRMEAVYPSTDYIYEKIDSLQAYAAANHARVINYPMLNVTQEATGLYRVMIALSLDKTLAGNDRIIIKRFVPWKMIEGEVLGGVRDVQRAMKQLYRFRDDYRLSIMALPFQSLVTDRRQERDSTKWVTKVLAPIS